MPNQIASKRKAARLPALALLVLSIAATAATAASNSSDAAARYKAERAVCNSGQSNQDRATCLKEAGAALKEARMGHLNDAPNSYEKNALIRCNAVPAKDLDACQRRIKGEGTTSGSALEGGVSREIVLPDNKADTMPKPDTMPMPMPKPDTMPMPMPKPDTMPEYK